MILCCGEALIDMVPEETVSGRQGFVPHCGGAVMNTAVALGRLGTNVGLLTGLSTDAFGQQMGKHLKASHVDLSKVVTSSRKTTLAFVALQDGQATYDFFDENTADRSLSLSDLPDISTDVTALFFGGISLAREPAADTYAAFLDRECGGRVVMLDPNIRGNFIPDEMRFRERLERMLAKTDILKVSDEDLNWLASGTLPLDMKAKKLMERGPGIVALTKGADGAIVFLRSGATVTIKPDPVDVIDTVGAGDTFNAGFLHALSELGVLSSGSVNAVSEADIKNALRLGSKAARISVTRQGANPPWAHELE